jgi:hypothetical protein
VALPGAGPEPLSPAAVETISRAVDQQPYETFVVELLVDEAREVRRTRVVHVQTGVEERWAGRDDDRLLLFVVTHGSLSPPG